MEKFSVTMSVYKNDKVDFIKKSLDSIALKQTVRPDEIIITRDGPVPEEVENLLLEYENKYHFIKVIRIDSNQGLGIAHQIGVNNCKNELIAIMDSDDIAVQDRFEKQLKVFSENSAYDLIGGQIEEFIDSIDNVVGKRYVPVEDGDIKKYIKKRCPFNHMTIMFKKSKVLEVGNYLDWHYNEDYYLYCRMFLANCKFYNLPDTLVFARVGKEMYKRRGGLSYFKSEKKLQKWMLKNKIINIFYYIFNVLIRFIVQVLMPNGIRSCIFQTLFRKKGI